MEMVSRVLAGICGFIFTMSGVQWIVQPEAAAKAVGMPLLDGIARSTEIGDLGAFFLASGGMILYGTIKKQKNWLLAPAIIVGSAAVCRTLAYLVQGADFATQFIAVEVVFTVILLFATSQVGNEEAGTGA